MSSKSNRIAAKAIFIGLCLDQFGSITIAFAASVILGIYLRSQGYSLEDMLHYARNTDVHNAYHYSVLLPGLLMSLLSGYVCARIAQRPNYTVSIIFACLDMCTAVLITLTHSPEKFLLASNLDYNAFFNIGSFAAVLLGARLAIPSIRNPPKLDDF